MGVWFDVEEKLPTKTDWYLVYAPTYRGGSSSSKESVRGMMFSKFNTNTGTWSIEHGYYARPGCVESWQYLNKPKKKKEVRSRVKKNE